MCAFASFLNTESVGRPESSFPSSFSSKAGADFESVVSKVSNVSRSCCCGTE